MFSKVFANIVHRGLQHWLQPVIIIKIKLKDSLFKRISDWKFRYKFVIP